MLPIVAANAARLTLNSRGLSVRCDNLGFQAWVAWKANILASATFHKRIDGVLPCRHRARRERSPLIVRRRNLPRRPLFRQRLFQPRDVLEQTLAGQDQEIVAELRVLEVDLE